MRTHILLKKHSVIFLAAMSALLLAAASAEPDQATGGLARVNHIIILVQENHSFDNYFGVLPYTPGANYHHPATDHRGCESSDHQCVDGLTCTVGAPGVISCINSNPSDDSILTVTHQTEYCSCNPEHEWIDAHRDADFDHPNLPTIDPNGFARVNAKKRKLAATAMSFYTGRDLPYYYELAKTFSISDRYFSSIIGPTLPNRMYLMAATSFGHVVTDPVGGHAENNPPDGGYKPTNGTIFDLLDRHNVSWAEYYEWDPHDPFAPVYTPRRPYGQLFLSPYTKNFKPLEHEFFEAARMGTLPQVVFIDLNEHEHPAYDIRKGQHRVAAVVDALKNGPNWKDSILFLTYDENGGFYDHVTPPEAVSPDDIPPGKCADRSAAPGSLTPGNGANCQKSAQAQELLCPTASKGERCADFKPLGFRIPLIAISPFAKPHYVSHVIADHTSLLALIEKRFLSGEHLTKRDAAANTPEDMFDFATSPSLSAVVSPDLAPASSDGTCQKPTIVRRSLDCF